MGGDKAATLQHKCVWATTCNKVRQWGQSIIANVGHYYPMRMVE